MEARQVIFALFFTSLFAFTNAYADYQITEICDAKKNKLGIIATNLQNFSDVKVIALPSGLLIDGVIPSSTNLPECKNGVAATLYMFPDGKHALAKCLMDNLIELFTLTATGLEIDYFKNCSLQ